MSKTQEPCLAEHAKPQICIQEWLLLELAHVEKARLARRAGQYARYQQIVAFHEEGKAPKVAMNLLRKRLRGA